MNGYVIIRNLVPPILCDDIRRKFDEEGRYYDGPLYRLTGSIPQSHKWENQGFLSNPILNVQSLLKALPAFRHCALQILTHDRVQRAVRILLGEQPKIVQSMFFEGNTNTPPHQDTYYLDAEEIGKMVAGWFALEDIAPGAGRFFVYPGSHEVDVLEEQGNPRTSFDHKEYMKRVILTVGNTRLTCRAPALAKGDVLFWNSKTIHGSLETTTPGKSRTSLTAHYIPETSRFLQLHKRIIKLNTVTVNGMKVHRPKDLARTSTRALMWFATSFPSTFQLARKIAVKIVTR